MTSSARGLADVPRPLAARATAGDHHEPAHVDVAGRIVVGEGAHLGERAASSGRTRSAAAAESPTLAPKDLEIGDRVYVGARTLLVHCALRAASARRRGGARLRARRASC